MDEASVSRKEPDSNPHSWGAPWPENIRCVQFLLNAVFVLASLCTQLPQFVVVSHEVIVSHIRPTVAGQLDRIPSR